MNDRPSMSVYDARRRLGSIVEAARSRILAYDAAGNLLGTFADRRDAIRAVERQAGTGRGSG